jgi:outer membrane protein assembly factor BamB
MKDDPSEGARATSPACRGHAAWCAGVASSTLALVVACHGRMHEAPASTSGAAPTPAVPREPRHDDVVPLARSFGAMRAVGLGGDVVLVGTRGVLVVERGADGAISERALPISAVPLTEGVQPSLAVVDGIVVQLQANELAAWRVVDGAAIGRAPLGDRPRAVALQGVIAHGPLVVLRVMGDMGDDRLIAVHREDASIAWQRPAASGETSGSAAGTIVSWGRDGLVQSIDASTGDPRWQLPMTDVAWVHPFEGLVVVVREDGTLVAANHESGEELARKRVVEGLAGIPVAGRGASLFVPAVAPPMEAAHCSVIVAVEAATLDVRWRTKPRCSLVDHGPAALLEAGDALISCGPDDVLRAYDVHTGVLRGSRGTRRCVDVVEAHAPDVLVVAALDEAPEASAAILAPAAFVQGTRPLTVRGTVRGEEGPVPRAKVQVGDVFVHADERGRYSASVAANGTTYVQAATREATMTRRIPIPPSAPATVELDLELWPYAPEVE